MEVKTFICSFGVRHNLQDGFYINRLNEKEWSESRCGCREKFGVNYLNFLEWCQENFKTEHTHQIKQHMQNEFLRANSVYNQ